jgi:hypothetical protein
MQPHTVAVQFCDQPGDTFDFCNVGGGTYLLAETLDPFVYFHARLAHGVFYVRAETFVGAESSPDRKAIGAYFPVSLLGHLVPPLRWNSGVVTEVAASLSNPITWIGGSSIRQTSNSRNPHPAILAGGRAGLLIFDFNAQRAPVRPLATLFQLAIAQAAARVEEARRAAQRAADRIGRQGNPQ